MSCRWCVNSPPLVECMEGMTGRRRQLETSEVKRCREKSIKNNVAKQQKMSKIKYTEGVMQDMGIRMV